MWWLHSDSLSGLGFAHVPILLARSNLSNVKTCDPSCVRFSLMGSQQNVNKKTSWWYVYRIDSCGWKQTRKWAHKLLPLRFQGLVELLPFLRLSDSVSYLNTLLSNTSLETWARPNCFLLLKNKSFFVNTLDILVHPFICRVTESERLVPPPPSRNK